MTNIISAVRTPIGLFQGALKDFSATDLGAVAIKEAVKSSGVGSNEIEECIMGCVLSAGLGQAPARQALIKAGLPESIGCSTINKVCGSGLKSVMITDSMIRAKDVKCAIAGGMESMTNAPYLIDKARAGLRMGNAALIDEMICDGLWDPYSKIHMGSFADECALKNKISREDQDKFAIESYKRAQRAIKNGIFKDEIVSVSIPQRKGDPIIFDKDEPVSKADFDKLIKLKPSFSADGTVTAANASSISDGAAALIISDENFKTKTKPLARIIASAEFSKTPREFTTAPIGAIERLLTKTGLKTKDIDLFEINEAFSCVAIAAMRHFKLSHDRVNIDGGAVALGHPIGASGARILVTLVHALIRNKLKRGMAVLCIGGGESVAMIVER